MKNTHDAEAEGEEDGGVAYSSLTPAAQRELLHKAIAFLQAGQRGQQDASGGPKRTSEPADTPYVQPSDSDSQK